MSVNSSSFDDIPFEPLLRCMHSELSISVISAFFLTSLFLLPLPALVLYLGYQRWRKQRSTSTPTSHSDIITYHCIIMQLNEFFGVIVFLCGANINIRQIMMAGSWIWEVTSIGQALFHLLTCVERYLAVVHPVTYRGLRRARGVRIRNISIGYVWFLSFGCLAVSNLTSFELNIITFLCIRGFFLIAISFLSISVLCTLKRPGPGDVGGNRERVDQSKQKAFRTIMAIMGVLLFRFGGDAIAYMMYISSALNSDDICLMFISLIWIELPSFLVLPLLFLNRAGKLPCCKQNTESGGG